MTPGAERDPSDIFQGNPHLVKLVRHERPEVKRSSRSLDIARSVRSDGLPDLGPDLETAGSDGRPENDPNVGRKDLSHLPEPADARRDDPRRGPSPARMERPHELPRFRGGKYRKAVGGKNPHLFALIPGDESVPLKGPLLGPGLP